MTKAAKADNAKLREALYHEKWVIVKQIIAGLPTTLPPRASSSELAAVLDNVRTAADCFTEACTFTSAFDTVYAARETLAKLGVCEWAAYALKAFQDIVSVAVRLANVFCVLAPSTNGRHYVGSTGAVDLLTAIWRRHPSCVDIVTSLSCLCCGHIDNVSRVMRQRGIVIAIDILNGESYMDNPRLLEKVLLLVGFCAICTPDNVNESKMLVPAIITALERLNEAQLPNVAVHAISALGNMGDCWLKESYGYEFSDAERTVDAVLATWMTNSRSTMVTEAASRTLLVLSMAHPAARKALVQRAEDLRAAIIVRRKHDSIVEALLDISGATDNPSFIQQKTTRVVPFNNTCKITKSDDIDKVQDIFTPSDDEPLVRPSCSVSKSILKDIDQELTPGTVISNISAEGLRNSADKYPLKAQGVVKPRRYRSKNVESSQKRVATQTAAGNAKLSPREASLRRSGRKRKLPSKLLGDDSSKGHVRTLNDQCERESDTIRAVSGGSHAFTPNSGGTRGNNHEPARPRTTKRARRQVPVASHFSSPYAQEQSDPIVISLISDDDKDAAGNGQSIVAEHSVGEDNCRSASDKDVIEASPVHVQQTAIAHDLVEWRRRRRMRYINN